MNGLRILHKNSKRIQKSILCVTIFMSLYGLGISQQMVIGMGETDGVIVTSSSSSSQTDENNTLNSQGFLPNLNAASRFLSQATFGSGYDDITQLSQDGLENWIDDQFNINRPFQFTDRTLGYHLTRLNNGHDIFAPRSFFDFSWWHYHMTGDDVLRQRVAFALSEFFVVSEFSAFGDNSYALDTYYDMLLDGAFGNYRELLEDVTFHPAMAQYLTYMGNPKTNVSEGTFPDENYAREVMQLFSIGLVELETNGEAKLNAQGNPIPTYDNVDIAEFAKIFTGFNWGLSNNFYEGMNYQFEISLNSIDSFPGYYYEYFVPLKMYNSMHEPGTKNLLNGFVVPDRNPVDGVADVNDALDNLFNHDNVGPFLGKFLIQRLVTSNPSPDYIERVAEAFNGNSQYSSTRGDLKAVIKAILLDEEARSCSAQYNDEYGKLREPFVRYIQTLKSFDAYTTSGNHRNAMYSIYNFVEQKPFTSPSVFNFFQSDYSPIGSIDAADKVAPEFQITNTQSIAGYMNGLHEWLMEADYADVWSIFDAETGDERHLDYPMLDFQDEIPLQTDEQLPILLDRLNLILAHGKMSEASLDAIEKVVKEFEYEAVDCSVECDPNGMYLFYCLRSCEIQRTLRIRIAMYLIMSSPEYLINR